MTDKTEDLTKELKAAPKPKTKPTAMEKLLHKIISKKLLVFVTGTGLLCAHFLDASDWLMLAVAFIGGESIISMATAWKTGVNPGEHP